MSLIDKLRWNREKRKSEMQQISVDFQWGYEKKGDPGDLEQLKHFKLFKYGHSRKALNLIKQTQNNIQHQIFDYEYVISTGNSSALFRQTVYFANSRSLTLPQFYQKPENFLEKLLAFLGMEDIDFEKFPEYSDKYHLKGEYESVIRYYFSPDILYLLSNQYKLSMEGMHFYFILYQHKKVIPGTQLASFKNLGMMLTELFLARSSEATKLLEGEWNGG
ncbi:MAG: hypothetical protein IPM34_07730 [Saprospiraceae bacterium]|nr:hypothetical protein [Saprospiraceae bacterium]